MSEQQTINVGGPTQKHLGFFGGPLSTFLMLSLLGLLAAVVAAGVVYWAFEKEYEASAWLSISSQEPWLAYAPAESDSEADDLYVKTQVELIRSPLVLGAVMSQAKAAEVPEFQEAEGSIQWLADKIKVSAVGKSDLFKISLTCSNPKDSARLVNAVTREYFLLLGQEEAKRDEQLINMLMEERNSREHEVKRLREHLRELTRQITGEDPFSPVPRMDLDLGQPIAELNSRLITTEVEQEVLSVRIRVLQSQLSEKQALIDQQIEEQPESVAESGLVEEAIEQDLQVQQTQQRIEASQAKLRDLELTLVADNVEENLRLQELRDAISQGEAFLEDLRAVARERIEEDLASSQSAQLNRELKEMESQRDELQLELEGNLVMEELLRERLREKLNETQVYSGDTLELYFVRDELTEVEGVLAILSERILRLTTEQRAPDRVRLLRPAVEAVAPVVAAPYVAMAAASTAGFSLPFLIFGLSCLMGRPRPLEDPVFCGVWFDKPGLWRGEVSFPGEGVVDVAIAAGRKGPTDADRQISLELRHRYADLKPSIANLLFDKFTIYQGEAAEAYSEPRVPTLSQPNEIWDHTCLEGFRIDKGPNSSIPYLRLVYTFEWDESRLFFAYLWDWEAVRMEVEGLP